MPVSLRFDGQGPWPNPNAASHVTDNVQQRLDPSEGGPIDLGSPKDFKEQAAAPADTANGSLPPPGPPGPSTVQENLSPEPGRTSA